MPDQPTRDAAADAEKSPPAKSPLEILDVVNRLQHTRRNEPCPCGSGRKYKKCCLPRDEARAHLAALAREELKSRIGRPAPAGEPLASARSDDEVVDVEAAPVADSASDGASLGESGPGDFDDESALPPDVRRTLDGLWEEFDAIIHPTTEQMDAHLARLLALPPEGTAWNDLLQRFISHRHADLPGVFRRIAASVRPSKGASLSFFFWGAIEEFVKRRQPQLVPEIVAGFCTLDRHTYDADALHHVGLWTMAAGCEAEALVLTEQFLPEMRADHGLMPHAVPGACRLLFELRVGARLRERSAPGADSKALARELLRGFKKEIDADYARRAAAVICGTAPALVATRREFELPLDAEFEEPAGWDNSLRRFEALMQVACEAWEFERRPPGIAFHGLQMLVDAAYTDLEGRPSKLKRAPLNLLDCLDPSGMERRVARSSHDMLGTNAPHAHLLLEAHTDLLRFAVRHHLIEAHLAAKSEKNVAKLKAMIGFPG